MKKLGNESGQTLVMVALSMAILLGFAAFATDIGVMLHEKRTAQSAADSAAIAAAISASQGNTLASATYAGQTAATSNGYTDGKTDASGNTTSVVISWPPADGHFAGQTGYVEATVTQQTPTYFMRVFGQNSLTVATRAVATYKGNASGCLYILNPTNAPLAANPWGNSTISAANCGILTNGNMKLGASDSVVAAYVAASGTITGPQHITGTYSQGTAEFQDPLSQLNGVLPTISGSTCTSPANPPIPPATTGTAGPACFLNQPLVNDPSTNKLLPGVYYYTDPTKATYTGNVVGDDVTIVLTNGSLLSATGGSGVGNATLTLTKPLDTSAYSGIVLDAPNYTGELDLDFGATVAVFNGTIYAPQADLSLQDQGGSSGTGAGVTVNGNLIIGTLDVNNKNKGNLTINSTSTTGGSPIPKIALVE